MGTATLTFALLTTAWLVWLSLKSPRSIIAGITILLTTSAIMAVYLATERDRIRSRQGAGIVGVGRYLLPCHTEKCNWSYPTIVQGYRCGPQLEFCAFH